MKKQRITRALPLQLTQFGGALNCVLFVLATLGAAVVGALLARAVLRKILTKYGMLGGSASGPKATA